MRRREFNGGLAGALAGLPAFASDQKNRGAGASPFETIEARVQGRLGVAVLDTATGRVDGWRLDERFPMCSTFKWLLAAAVLQRVDAGGERLDRRIAFGRDALAGWSPVTGKRVGGAGMSVAELCEAAVTVSDNTAANLLLAAVGGPEAITRCARSLGDTQTRLDRIEPALNEALPGDPRDTTTPRAMSTALRSALLGDGLPAPARAQLTRWMLATTTGTDRLRAGLPAGWRVADKTGTGDRGSTNDVAVVWPAAHAPLVVVAYLTDCAAPAGRREAALADVARAVAKPLAPGFTKAQ